MDVRGVDFSGSKRPGRDVWLADGGFDGDRLAVTACRPAAEAFGATAREPVLDALRASLRSHAGTTGLDFSFGLPAELLPSGVERWTDAVEWFADEFAGPVGVGVRELVGEPLDGIGPAFDPRREQLRGQTEGEIEIGRAHV